MERGWPLFLRSWTTSSGGLDLPSRRTFLANIHAAKSPLSARDPSPDSAVPNYHGYSSLLCPQLGQSPAGSLREKLRCCSTPGVTRGLRGHQTASGPFSMLAEPLSCSVVSAALAISGHTPARLSGYCHKGFIVGNSPHGHTWVRVI